MVVNRFKSSATLAPARLALALFMPNTGTLGIVHVLSAAAKGAV